jgi:anaerobic selenocysteine-containing dehydrogenase
MQALTGMFAKQFGTPNYAAHGGFCSVNMAAGMIYSIGGSFWEFGGPDLERAKLFVMIGTAEDHHSNPLKMQISKFKRRGGRFISINPVRTGYSAIADEWVPIKPGTDGALFLALIHEIIKRRPVRPRVPGPVHQRRRAGHRRPQARRPRHVLPRPRAEIVEGCTDPENKLWWDRNKRPDADPHQGRRPAPDGQLHLPDGTR